MLYGSQKEYYDAMVASAGLRGAVYWVDSVNGDSSHDGLSSDRPMKTIAQAIALSNTNIALTANTNKNNTIFIRGGTYTEDLTGAAGCDLIGLDLNKRGWSPRINGTLTCDSINGMRLFNLQLQATAAADEAVIVTDSHNLELYNCELRAAASSSGYGVHLTSQSYYLKIVNCRFTAMWDYGIYIDGKCKALEVYDCFINAKTCGIYIATGNATTTSFDGLVKNNVITRSDPNTSTALVTGINMAAQDAVTSITFVDNRITATNPIAQGLDDGSTFVNDGRCINNLCIDMTDGKHDIVSPV